jgi:hypothetical protein
MEQAFSRQEPAFLVNILLHLHHRNCPHFLGLGLPSNGLGPCFPSLSLWLAKPILHDLTVAFPLVQDVSKILRQTLELGFLHQNKGKRSSQNMSDKSFPGTVQQRVDLNPFDFLLWGYLKTLVYSATVENETHFIIAFFMPVKRVSPSPRPLKVCDSPWSDVSIRALVQVGDILRICCELWRDK